MILLLYLFQILCYVCEDETCFPSSKKSSLSSIDIMSDIYVCHERWQHWPSPEMDL